MTPAKRAKVARFRRIVSYSRDTVMTPEQCAYARQIGTRTLERADLPCCYITNRTRRYVWGWVVDALSTRADVVTPHRRSHG